MLLSLSGSAYLCGGRLSDLTQQVCHMIHMRIDSSFMKHTTIVNNVASEGTLCTVFLLFPRSSSFGNAYE